MATHAIKSSPNRPAPLRPGQSYIGRFAPSPTGPLHMGSLVAALASYLDARANNGLWLLRMEDLDPPREPEGAAELILNQLVDLGLHWDGEVLYQSTRQQAYADALARLARAGLCYPCNCSRKQIRAMGLRYDGRCARREQPPRGPCAIRVRTQDRVMGFTDAIQGYYEQHLVDEVGDFVIKRKDELFAYQLAVVVDDAYQQVTHIVRGHDLLDSTPRQLYLQQLLGYPQPAYAHIPVIVNRRGQKLSKQRFAAPLDARRAPYVLHEALKFLGQRPPAGLAAAGREALLEWGIANWELQSVPKLANIPEHSA